MKHVLILGLVAATLSGCASLQYAGNASYSVSPYESKTGALSCCKVEVHNGKEIANVEAHISKTAAGDYVVDIKEQGVLAFQGQQIAAGATKDMIDASAKIAVAAALAPLLPALVPVVGGALLSPGISAAAVGAAGVLGVQKFNAIPAPIVAPVSIPDAVVAPVK